jgi:hypothetical protein
VTLDKDEDNNTKWIRIADPDYSQHTDFYENRMAVNAGLLYGSMEGWMHFFNIFLKLPMFQDFKIPTIDQGFLNYMYHRKKFEEAGLNLTVSKPGDYLLSVRGGAFEVRPNENGLFLLRGTKRIPAAIHQYNRICPLFRELQLSCPRMWFDTKPFAGIKDVSQKCSNKYVDRIRYFVTTDHLMEVAQKIYFKLPFVKKQRQQGSWMNK